MRAILFAPSTGAPGGCPDFRSAAETGEPGRAADGQATVRPAGRRPRRALGFVLASLLWAVVFPVLSLLAAPAVLYGLLLASDLLGYSDFSSSGAKTLALIGVPIGSVLVGALAAGFVTSLAVMRVRRRAARGRHSRVPASEQRGESGGDLLSGEPVNPVSERAADRPDSTVPNRDGEYDYLLGELQKISQSHLTSHPTLFLKAARQPERDFAEDWRKTG